MNANVDLYRGLDQLPGSFQSGAVSIGNFDGVHLGHAQLVARLVTLARQHGGAATVFTFDPHPVELLRPAEAPARLTTTARKAQLLGALGVDAVIAYPTTMEFLQLEAAEYFEAIVRRALAARCLVEGPNFFFGKDRGGTVELLRQLCPPAGVALEIVPPCQVGGEFVSSSRVRQALLACDVGRARRLLTRPYQVAGPVGRGAGRGHSVGFPTANLERLETLVPGPGVYAGVAEVGELRYPAAINIGPNPTFGQLQPKFEVHLVGFAGQLYGQRLAVDFLEHLRDIRTFASVEALRQQLRSDVRRAGEIAEAVACEPRS